MSPTRARLAKRLVTTVQTLALLLAMAVPAAADTVTQTQTANEKLQILTEYRIVRGDDSGNYNLTQPITRAEMAAIMVRALGLDAEAENLKDTSLFPDTKNHWATGYINLARLKGIVKGDDQGNFRPGSPVTYAEAFTMILRLVDHDPTTTGSWPTNVLLEAIDLKVLPEGFAGFSAMNQPAVRGDVFQSLATALSLRTATGQTYLQKLVDSVPPELSINAIAATTPNATITISGTVKGASVLLVNGNQVSVATTGQFSTTVNLQNGPNTIKVEASDRAGNKANSSVSVTRALPAAKLDVTGPAEVAVNSSSVFTVTAYDASDKPVSAEGLSAKVDGSIGIYDTATNTFKAANRAGAGKITFTLGNLSKSVDVKVLGENPDASRLFIRMVNNGLAVPKSREMTVEVEVQNSMGQHLTNDYGRPITLLAGGVSGLTITPSTTMNTQSGVATFKVRGGTEGTITLTASSGSLAASTRNAEFGTPIQIVLSADSSNLTLGGSPYMTRIKAELRDDQGNPVINNTDSDILISLGLNGVGVLSDQYLTIRRGYSNSTTSGDDGRFEVGGATGSGQIRGTVTSNHKYSITGTSVGITQPSVGSGARLEVMSPPNTLTPGDSGTFIIRVVDANGATVTAGSYAFQVKIDTSNNDPKTNGIPSGITATLGGTAQNPISDDIAEGASNDTTDVVGRTVNGQAVVNVRYTKGGSVTVTPVMVSGTNQGYSDTGSVEAAASSTFMQAKAASAVWTKAAHHFNLTVDSDLGTDQSTGAVSNSSSRFFTVRVRVVDEDGNWVPNASNSITLTRTVNGGATTPPSPETVTSNGGIAEFRIYATASAPGMDTYTASSAGLVSGTVNLYTRNAVSTQPIIQAIRGVKNGVPNQTWSVAADDTHMEIDLASQPAAGWISVKVYTEGGSTPIYTSGAINMADLPPQVRVPKDKVPTGNYRYQVVLANGYSDSPRSEVSNTVTHARTLSGYNIHTVRYDGVTKVLTVYTNQYLSTTDGFIDTSKLSIVKGNGTPLSLLGTVPTIPNNSASHFTVNVAGLAGTLETAQYSGSDVVVKADAGWYMRTNGDAAQATTSSAISPLAVATAVTYDSVRKTVTIEGAGLHVGALQLNQLSIKDPSTTQTFLFNSTNAYQSPSRTDNRIVISLTDTGNNALKNPTNFDGGDVLLMGDGWIQYDAQSRIAGNTVGLPVYSQVTVTGVRYNKTSNILTIIGSGFGGNLSTLNSQFLKIVDSNAPASALTLGAPVAATVDNDGVISIELTTGGGSQAEALETPATFDGDNIYLVGDENWLVDGNGRSARAIPAGTVRLPNPSQWQQ